MEKKTICIDFDGVIAQYEGWKGEDVFGEPVDGVQTALEVLKKNGYTIIIYTTRSANAKLKKYLEKNSIPYDYINENPDQPEGSNKGKPIADVYIDDRAICFRGNWKYTLEEIAMFKPYSSGKKNEREEYEKAFEEYRKLSKNNVPGSPK